MYVPFGGHRHNSVVTPAGVASTDIVVKIYTGSSLVENASLTAAAQGSLRQQNDDARVVNYDYSVIGVAAGTSVREVVTSTANVFAPISTTAVVGPEPVEVHTHTQTGACSCGCGTLKG